MDRSVRPGAALAAGYDEFVTGSHMDLAEEALERAGVRPGMHLLDVACGSGALSMPAARLGARVTAVDISAGIPVTFRSALTSAGLTDVRIEAVTGQVEYHSGQHMWDWVTNSYPIGAALVAELTTEQRASVREMLDDLLRQRSGAEHGAVLRHAVYVGLATR